MTRLVEYRPWGLGTTVPRRWGGPIWSPLNRLHQEMNRLFEESLQRGDADDDERRFNPSLDVDQEEDRYEITMELPGVARNDVKVEVRDDYLLISGSKRESQKSDKNEGVHRYRRYGSFQQALSLPEDASRDDISADFRDGVLTVKVPRNAELQRDRVRQIEVTERADDRHTLDSSAAESGGDESGIDVDITDDGNTARRQAARAGSHEQSGSEQSSGEQSPDQTSTG